jgi:asparagine synthase (glutamine-hydrolysing)
MREYDGFPWARSTTIRQNLLQEWLIREIDPVDFIHERYLQTIQTADILPENEPKERRIKELVNLNLYWFMQTLLDRGDRMGAAAGLEIRAPFCDYRIVEYLYGVPWDYKAYRGLEKGLLRKSMEGLLPQHVLYRKKSPFPKTYDPQYLQIATTLFEALLQKPNSPLFHFVSRKGLEELLHGDFSWPWYGQLMLKPQTMMYMYQINSWLNHYSVTIV